MNYASNIREHMEVVGSDGGHVGRVDHVDADQIELAKLDPAGGLEHHLIPLSWVDYVEEDTVRLGLTGREAMARWTARH